MTAERPIVIIGSGGHARVIIDACGRSGQRVAGVLAPTDAGGAEAPYLGDDTLMNDARFMAAHQFIIGLGDMRLRRRIGDDLKRRAVAAATVIHPSAVIGSRVRWGEGLLVCAGAVINPDVVLGCHAVINTRASIDHNCLLGDHVFVAPGVTLSGGVHCGDDVLIGAGACTRPNVRIGSRVTIGAGAVLISDIDDDCMAVGVPARQMPRSDVAS